MGSILKGQYIDERMAELTAALGHQGQPDPSRVRACARCGQYRGRGHKWCAACRQQAKQEYNAEYHRKHYRRLSPEELSAAKRAIVNRRWRLEA